MATFAIGDLQGCYYSFLDLLATCRFDPAVDRLWLVGDLVNRGPHSLAVLRWMHSHADCVHVVLGNHDLHALAVHAGCATVHRGDTLEALLTATDRDLLFDWLRRQPLTHAENGYLMVHAGLLPQWDAAKAIELAGEVETVLRGPDYPRFLAVMYGNEPDHWDEALTGLPRLRVILNAMTRLRICTPKGRMEFKFKGQLQDIPPGYLPWFEVQDRKSREDTLIVGHWSALGLVVRENLIALDSGCVWGGKLSAIRLEDRRLFQVSRAPEDAPARR
ncbi:MAG: symmetrical bis(5'-nucleosyl)-tetraphosphatase [Methylophilaceae bacterium]|nr:symmetrical bis(5'-nucleosyl)-tetraphosphatase [Methylophilaceae bacterium]